MKKLAVKLGIVFISILGNCKMPGSDFFEFEGKYRAKISDFQLIIHTRGEISHTPDIGNLAQANVLICPLGNVGTTLNGKLIFNPKGEILWIDNYFQKSLLWNGKTSTKIIGDLLKKLGYQPNINELKECCRVIDLSLKGPKGAVLKGQTQFLKVETAGFRNFEDLPIRTKSKEAEEWIYAQLDFSC